MELEWKNCEFRKEKKGEETMKKQILIVGSLNMDMVIEMRQMPLVGETVLGKSLSYIPGGKGANQAFAAGKLGGNAVMLGCVGTDEMGKKLTEKLAESGTEVSHVAAVSGVPTGTAVIYVNESGNNSIVVVAGANSACDVEFLKANEELLRASDYVMFQMEIPFEAVFYGIRKAKEMGKTVILNPAPAPDPKEIPDDIWKCIDFLTPNETETAKLSGTNDTSEEGIRRGAGILREKGVKNVLITMGEQGAFFTDGITETVYPTRKADAVDTTAAGDCFNGAFVTALSKGMDIPAAVKFANIAASLAVERKGAQSSIPGREETEKIYMHNLSKSGN